MAGAGATEAGIAAHGCSGTSLPTAVVLHLSFQLCPGSQMLPSHLTNNAINTIAHLRHKRVPQVTPCDTVFEDFGVFLLTAVQEARSPVPQQAELGLPEKEKYPVNTKGR